MRTPVALLALIACNSSPIAPGDVTPPHARADLADPSDLSPLPNLPDLFISRCPDLCVDASNRVMRTAGGSACSTDVNGTLPKKIFTDGCWFNSVIFVPSCSNCR